MADTTTGGTTRLPQAALDHADKVAVRWPPLTDAQKADLARIIYGSRPTSSAAEERGPQQEA